MVLYISMYKSIASYKESYCYHPPLKEGVVNDIYAKQGKAG